MTLNPTLNLIVAATKQNGIGFNNDLPWTIKADLKYFSKTTTHYGRVARVFDENSTNSSLPLNVVIMGRKTWESIPVKFRPLKDRMNIVITRNPDLYIDQQSYFFICIVAHYTRENVHFVNAFESALEILKEMEYTQIFVIGGGSIYAKALEYPGPKTLFLTRVECTQSIKTNVSFPEWNTNNSFQPLSSKEILNEFGQKFPIGVQREGDYQFEFLIYKTF